MAENIQCHLLADKHAANTSLCCAEIIKVTNKKDKILLIIHSITIHPTSAVRQIYQISQLIIALGSSSAFYLSFFFN